MERDDQRWMAKRFRVLTVVYITSNQKRMSRISFHQMESLELSDCRGCAGSFIGTGMCPRVQLYHIHIYDPSLVTPFFNISSKHGCVTWFELFIQSQYLLFSWCIYD